MISLAGKIYSTHKPNLLKKFKVANNDDIVHLKYSGATKELRLLHVQKNDEVVLYLP